VVNCSGIGHGSVGQRRRFEGHFVCEHDGSCTADSLGEYDGSCAADSLVEYNGPGATHTLELASGNSQ
jgi:hypothetical protein